MKKYLLLFFLLSLTKITRAQVSSMVSASATIVNPVGTEEVEEEESMQPGKSGNVNQKFSHPVSMASTGKTRLARFRVINETFVYAVTVIPFTTENFSLQKKARKRLVDLDVDDLAGAGKEDLFTLQATTETARLFSSQTENRSLPDVVIHFN